MKQQEELLFYETLSKYYASFQEDWNVFFHKFAKH